MEQPHYPPCFFIIPEFIDVFWMRAPVRASDPGRSPSNTLFTSNFSSDFSADLEAEMASPRGDSIQICLSNA